MLAPTPETGIATSAIEGVHYLRHHGRVFPIVRGGADGDPPAPETDPGDPKVDDAKPDQPNTGPVRVPDDHPLVKTAKARKSENDELRAKLKEYEDAKLSDTERKDNALATEKSRADTAEAETARLRVAMAHGLTAAEDLELLGTGTPDQLEARAKRIAELRGDPPDPARQPVGSLGKGGDGPTEPSTDTVLASIPPL